MTRQRQTPIERARAECAEGESACELCLRIRPSHMMARQADGRLACPICVADGRAVDTRPGGALHEYHAALARGDYRQALALALRETGD